MNPNSKVQTDEYIPKQKQKKKRLTCGETEGLENR